MQLFSRKTESEGSSGNETGDSTKFPDPNLGKKIPNSGNVLSNKMSGGPMGLGDPNDRHLRKVEIEVMIPKIIRERAKKEKCPQQKEDFDKCCLDNAMLMVANCRGENRRYQECITRCFNDKTFVQECTEVYLAQRAEFRRTGIKQKLRAKNVK